MWKMAGLLWEYYVIKEVGVTTLSCIWEVEVYFIAK
jgi:hypothetical protein